MAKNTNRAKNTTVTVTNTQTQESLDVQSVAAAATPFHALPTVETQLKDGAQAAFSVSVSSLGVQGKIELTDKSTGHTQTLDLAAIPNRVLAFLLCYGIKQHWSDAVVNNPSHSAYLEQLNSVYRAGYRTKAERNAANKPAPAKAGKAAKAGNTLTAAEVVAILDGYGTPLASRLAGDLFAAQGEAYDDLLVVALELLPQLQADMDNALSAKAEQAAKAAQAEAQARLASLRAAYSDLI